MRLFRPAALAAVAFLALTGLARAEVKVQLKNVHNCCGACVAGIQKAVKSVDGAAVEIEDDTLTLTAADNKTAQKAVDALAAAGFQGESDNKKIAMRDDSGAPKGKVLKLTVSGAHNCCRSCCVAIKEAIKEVPGVTSDTASPKSKTFEVEGDFDAAALVKALNDAGFHVTVTK
jgi:mercuric ion binding protein